ncbi:transcriptional regulator, putative [Heliomicrobium modesticaldum Ice1]|uniref:Transcriptional regulator, putative n=1 Tax=Heliobacterium modesticaldum (strain ATCC 51547 / Ice1) TaxID=498761 RepID=B0TCE2_HELMI|nr:helix-turn-helix domain-containing protein [Heliomicrobium modesticaldum]ABZ85330.1 transcriptional regulator, putative [Heliomicrobium modesticaldum Ice1]
MDHTWIRRVREEKGLSLQEVSRLSGVSVSYLSEIERGTKQPAPRIIDKISTALGLKREEGNPEGGEIGLGQKLRLLREERGLALQELARLAGISIETLRAIEAEEVRPSVDTLRTLADHLNVSIPQLMGSLTVIATRLRSIREQLGLTQAEVAERAGVSPGLIGQIEQGKVQPSLRTIERVAEAVGVTPCYFLVPQPSLENLLPVLGDDLIRLLGEPPIQQTLRMIYDLNEAELRFLFGVVRLIKQTGLVGSRRMLNEEACLSSIEEEGIEA